MKPLKMLLSSAICLILLTACGGQNSPTSTPAEVELSARVDPEPPAVGSATLIVTLRDSKGSPLDGAILQVHGDMDHAGMSPIDRETRESTDGEYRMPFEWTMGGGWIVTVTATLPDGGKVSRDFSFTVEAVSSESIIKRPIATSTPANTLVNIAYSADHNPVLAGDGFVTITLTNPDGTPLTDATVTLVGNMMHQGMMPITAEGKHTGNGQYQVSLRWTMAGDWQVTVRVTRADGTKFERIFDQEVVMP